MTALKFWLLGILFLVAFLAATPFVHAAATTRDGNGLLTRCEAAIRLAEHPKDGDAESGAYCLGYVNGILAMATDTTVTLVNSDHRTSLPCAPAEGLTTGQAVRVVLKYLNSHPETLHKPAKSLVVFALREAFPCK